MKKYIPLLIIVTTCFINQLFAQKEYYYYKGEKQYLSLDKKSLNITTSSDFQKISIDETNLKEAFYTKYTTTEDRVLGNIKLKSVPEEKEYEKIIESLSKDKNVIAIHPNYITEDSIEIGMSSYFYVKLKNASDYNLMQKIADEKNVEIVEQNRFMPPLS